MAVWAPCHGFCHDLEAQPHTHITIPLHPSLWTWQSHLCGSEAQRYRSSNGLGVFCGSWPARRLFHLVLYTLLPPSPTGHGPELPCQSWHWDSGLMVSAVPPEMMTLALFRSSPETTRLMPWLAFEHHLMENLAFALDNSKLKTECPSSSSGSSRFPSEMLLPSQPSVQLLTSPRWLQLFFSAPFAPFPIPEPSRRIVELDW